jgi:protein TonB
MISRHYLAWSPEQGEKQRIKRIASVVTPLFLVLAVMITWVDLPEMDREEMEKLPPQLARVVLKKKEPPKPEIKKEEKKPEPIPEPEKKPEPQVVEKPKPKPKPKVVQKPKPSEQAKPEEIKAAREKAKNSGLLAMSNQLSKLSSLAESVKLDTPKTVTAKPIARKVGDKLATNAVATTRSAGVQGADLNTETKQIDLASRQVAEVAEAEEVLVAVEQEEIAARRELADRSTEDIRRTMDANKSSIHSIYNRALRKKPSLQGVVTPELVIEDTGVVSSCNIIESTLNEPDLERKICNRLRLVNFGEKSGVDKKTVRYPIELLPG